MRKKILGCALGLLCGLSVWAQVPQIDNVAPVEAFAYPSTEVQITGSGFSSNVADLQVWFGNVKGTITEASTSSIKVTIPAQARLSAVTVINLASKRSATSAVKLTPNYSGVASYTNNFRRRAFTSAQRVFDLCSCDFDGDGKTDIVGSKDANINLFLLTNTSTVHADSTVINFTSGSVSLEFQTNSVTCGDINGDGKPEIIATRGGTPGNFIYILPNTSTVGNISFGTRIPLELPSGDLAREVAIRDLNKDGRPEIIVTNASTQNTNISIFQNLLTSGTIVANEFTLISKAITGATSTLALDVEDFSGDGWPDIAVIQNNNSTKIFFVKNPADGTLNYGSVTVQNITVTGSNNLNDIASADFNLDGKIDIVVADRGVGRAFVLLNSSTTSSFLFPLVSGTFSTAVAHGVDVADMNGDGYPDFAVASRELAGSPQMDVYISNAQSTLNFTKESYVAPFDNWFVKMGDFDGDSKPDIAMTVTDNSSNFGIHVLRNRHCHKPVILNPAPLTICDGQTIELRAVDVKGVTFAWKKNGSAAGTGSTLSISNSTGAGTYVVEATGENASPQKCLSVASTALVVSSGAGTAPAAPTITQPTGVCSGTSLTLQTTTLAGASYFWNGPNGYEATTAVPSALVTNSATTLQKGDYFLRVKVGDCFSNPSAAKFVDVIEPASFTITGPSGVCTGQPVSLSVNNNTDYNYQWKRGATNVGTNSATYSIASAAAIDEASYTVVVSHKTITCSSETAAFALNLFTAPVAAFTKTPAQVCVGTEVSFNATTSTVDNTATVSYGWTFGDTGTGNGNLVTHTYSAASGSVSVVLTISYSGVTGCSDTESLSFAVNAATPPTIVTDPADVTEICSNGTETLTLTVPETFTSYTWSTAETTQSIEINEPGVYSVTTVNAGGCQGTVEIELLEKPGCSAGEAPTIPRVFTPNGDGANDTWKIASIESNPDCELNLFDKRGMRVFTIKASAFPVTGWDGVANGKAVPDGTYYYVFGCPEGRQITGSVLIIR